MHIDRAHADRSLAFLGFALSFLFLLAIVAFPTARPIFRDAADRKA
jgi:hypothetical protein